MSGETGPISPARLIQILQALGINPANLDVALSSRASEATTVAILAKMDDPANPMVVEDTGLNTNPERWLQIYHWNTAAEIPIVVAGAPGELALGAAVAAGRTRRIREVTVRHAGTNNTVVTIYDAAAGNILVTIDVPAQTTRVWSSQDGRAVAATLQPVIQTSDVVGGSTFVSAAGVEA